MLDFASLIAPIDDEAPCGPDRREEPEFRDLEDAPGDFANMKAPELTQVIERCDAFLQTSKDQAPALVALQAAVRVGDFALANAALELVKGFAEDYWESFHPAPADEMGVARINELSALARPAAMVLPLQRAALARMPSPSMQAFTAAMIAQACEPTGEWTSEDEAAISTQVESGQMSATQARTIRPTREGARILRTVVRVLSAEARMADAEAGVDVDDIGISPAQARDVAVGIVTQVEAARDALQTMSDLLYDINAIYDSRMGDSASLGPVLSVLRLTIEDATRFLATFPAEEAADEVDDTDAAGEVADGDSAESGGATATARPKAFVAMTPQSRADVLLALDSVIRFFVEKEPTSPVPLIVRRAKAWVEMDFLQLLNDIAPNGVDEAQRLLATPDDGTTEDTDSY